MADTEQTAPAAEEAANVQAAATAATPAVEQPAEVVEQPTDTRHSVVNNTGAPLPVKVRNADGKVEYLHIAGRKRVHLPDGYSVDHNYSVLNAHKMNVTIPTK